MKLLFVALCLLNIYAVSSSWPPLDDDFWSDLDALKQTTSTQTSEIPPRHQNEIPDPPSPDDKVKMARYVMHNTDWVSLATISTRQETIGFPFNNIKSMVDGSLTNSTGIPYFYTTHLDLSVKDLSVDKRATVLVTLEQTDVCKNHSYDPEDPRCTRVMLSGTFQTVENTTSEYTFAKHALFQRHPAMRHFPPEHNWFVGKLNITQVAMLDWFGGVDYIPVNDYLSYNYTDTRTAIREHN